MMDISIDNVKNYAKSILWIKHTLYVVVIGEKTN